MKKTKLGVVLSGGGAKGAYEVGFLKALAEFNIQPKAISGTSIGALNGAIYASIQETKKSASVLEILWNDLANSDVLELDKSKSIKNLIEVFTYFSPMPVGRLTKVAMALIKTGKSNEGVLTQLPIINRLKKYAPEKKLKNGLPFYVGVTKSRGNLKDVINFTGFGNEETEFKKIQDLNREDMHKAIMASASLPILFDGLEIEGQIYRDGCLSSTDNEWGNTPAKPLIEQEGCTHLIVCHLEEGSFFNRHDSLFKDIAIIEVRPKTNTFSSALNPLQFKVDKIEKWKEQGYKDTKRIIGEVFSALSGNYERQSSEYKADIAVDRLKNRVFKLE
jgi:NTE family protein